MKKVQDQSQETSVKADLVVGHLKELLESQGWKIVCKAIDKIISDSKEAIWIPYADQSMRFNSTNMLNEKITALYILRNLPMVELNTFKKIMWNEKQGYKPLEQKLEEHNKFLADQLKKYITAV